MTNPIPMPDEIANYTLQLPALRNVTEMILGFSTDDNGDVKLPLSTLLTLVDSYASASRNDQIYTDFMMLYNESARIDDERDTP